MEEVFVQVEHGAEQPSQIYSKILGNNLTREQLEMHEGEVELYK